MKTTTVLFAILVLALVGCNPSSNGDIYSLEKQEWGQTVNGLRCRLYVSEDESEYWNFMGGIPIPLIVEIQNLSNETLSVPVIKGTKVPKVDIVIQEESDVKSFRTSGIIVYDTYSLEPGDVLKESLVRSYKIAYGKITESGIDSFKPTDQSYHLQVKIDTDRGELISNTIVVHLKKFIEIERQIKWGFLEPSSNK